MIDRKEIYKFQQMNFKELKQVLEYCKAKPTETNRVRERLVRELMKQKLIRITQQKQNSMQNIPEQQSSSSGSSFFHDSDIESDEMLLNFNKEFDQEFEQNLDKDLEQDYSRSINKKNKKETYKKIQKDDLNNNLLDRLNSDIDITKSRKNKKRNVVSPFAQDKDGGDYAPYDQDTQGLSADDFYGSATSIKNMRRHK